MLLTFIYDPKCYMCTVSKEQTSAITWHVLADCCPGIMEVQVTYQIWLQGKFTKGKLCYIAIFICFCGFFFLGFLLVGCFLVKKPPKPTKNQTTNHHQNNASTMKYSQVIPIAFGEYSSLNRSMSVFQMMNPLVTDAYYIPICTH